MVKNAAPDLPVKLIDSESERLILSNILSRGGEFWRTVGPELTAEHFSVERHRQAFQLIRDVADSGEEPGLAACLGKLKDIGKSSEYLGLPLLSDLAYTDTIDLPDPERWVARLKRKAVDRRMWRLAERMRLSAESGTEDTAEELANLRDDLKGLQADLDTAATPFTLADAVAGIASIT